MSRRAARRDQARKATAPNVRHRAGVLTYLGDCTHLVGEVKGPTTYGSLLVAVDAEFTASRGSTRVTFAHCTDRDVDTIVRAGIGRVEVAA